MSFEEEPRYDPLAEAESIAMRADEEAEAREYPVTMRAGLAQHVEEKMRLGGLSPMVILYTMPSEEDWDSEVEMISGWEPGIDFDHALRVIKKLHGDLPLSEYNVPWINYDSERELSLELTTRDMDLIDRVLLDQIEYGKNFPIEWFVQGITRNDPTKDPEKERELWRNVNLEGTSNDMRILYDVNMRFIEAGAPPRPGFIRMFESFDPLNQSE